MLKLIIEQLSGRSTNGSVRPGNPANVAQLNDWELWADKQARFKLRIVNVKIFVKSAPGLKQSANIT